MQALVRKHPVATFSGMSAITSVLALRPLPSSIPLVALLVTIRIATQLITPRPHAVFRITLLWLALTLGCVISFASAGSAAINSFAPSIAYSAVFSALGLIPFLTCAKFRTKGFAFPAVWSTWWWIIASESPVGRLGVWSPLSGHEAYAWTRPFVGELAIDWMVGGWCEVLAGFAVGQMMGQVNNEEDAPTERSEQSLPLNNGETTLLANEESPLLPPPRRNDTQDTPAPRRRVVKPSNQVTLTALIIVLAAMPSTFLNPLPPPLHGKDRRDVGVACVLPELNDLHSPFETFLRETKTVAGQAHVVLWPEGAVAFASDADRTTSLKTVQETAAINGIWVGVGFTDSAPGEDAKGKRRNGLAVVSSEGVVLEYYKRHLVPLVESFPQIEGKTPPSIIDIKLGSKAKPAAQWNITLSASICLDFAHPSHDLESKPSIILGPARTWHTNVGQVMMEMARQRADELGTRILWCDGGEGGLSGVVGMGESGVQVGHGTWVRRLSFQVPIDSERTRFGKAGAGWGLLMVWSLVFMNVPTGETSNRPSLMQSALWRGLQGHAIRLLNRQN